MSLHNYPIQYYDSEEYFIHVVCNLTSLKPSDPIFAKIKEEDKRIIKEAGRIIHTIEANKAFDAKSRVKKTQAQQFSTEELPRNI